VTFGPARIGLDGLDAMQRALETVAKRSVPFAARELVNGMAFAGRRFWQEEMAGALTLRNKFTQRRALVIKARGLQMRSMEAVLGHPELYMYLLEHGGTEYANKRFRPIPSETAAGQAKGSLLAGRKQAVRPGNIITKLGRRLARGSKAHSRKANNARGVKRAIASGRRLVFLNMGRRQGIYRIKGGKKNPDIQKLYDLTKRSTPVPRIPTLEPTLARVMSIAPGLAIVALERQLERLQASKA
jgi:hypothetical protein